jgi:F0F1-type ATP synthase assembly protein I
MQKSKILLYIIAGLLVSAGAFMLLDKETNSLWSLLPFSLGVIIALLNKFKKIN